MRKTGLLLIISLLIVNAAIGRKIRLTDSGNVWRQYNVLGEMDEETLETLNYSMGGDTLAFGKVYKQPKGTGLYLTNYYGHYLGGTHQLNGHSLGYYREDTVLKQVWCVAPRLSTTDTAEYLIYDDNWKVGDTLNWQNTSFGTKGWVLAVDSTFFLNEWYRVFKIQSGYSHFFIIEGIGSTSGLDFPTCPVTFESTLRLSCFMNEGIRPTISPSVGIFDNSQSCALAVNQEGLSYTQPVVYPNPGRKEMVLKIPLMVVRGRLLIIDAIGRRVVVRINNVQEVRLGQYVSGSGVYSYVVQDEISGVEYKGRFVYQ